MAFDPTTDSWAPGEPPVGNASALPPDPDKPTGSLSPQRPTDFLGDLQARHDKVSGALAGEYGNYTQATSVLDQMEQQRVERDRGRMDQAFNMESAAANDPALNHPWNSDKERSERIRGPLENFGSVGTIFALAASAFTRTPMTSALNAAGAAMTAMHQSDEEGYKTAYEAWKANSDLAIKRFNIERNLYEDANKLVSTDLGLWRQKRASLAAQFDDRKRQIMLDMGMDAEVLKADDAYIQAGEKAIDFQKKFEDINLEKDIWQSKFAEWKEAHPPADPNNLTPQEHLEQYKAKNQFMLDAKKQVALSKSTAAHFASPDQEFAQRWWSEHPQGTAEEFGAAFGQYSQGKKPAAKGTPAQQFAAKWWSEHPDGTSEQFGQAFGQFQQGQKPPSQQRLSWGAEHAKNVETVMEGVRRDHPDWPEDKVTEEALSRVSQAQRGKQLSPDAINKIAEARLAGDTSGMTNIGRDNAVRVMQRSAEILAARGDSGESLKNADVGYQGERAAARTAGTRASNIAIAATDARKLAPIALEMSDKVWRTSSVPFNTILQKAESATSDTDLYKFKDATQSFLNAYVATISRTGVPTDRVREQAQGMLSTAYSAETYKELMKLFDREMKAAESAPLEYFKMVSKGGLTGSTSDKGIIQKGRDGKSYRFKGDSPDQMTDKSKWELVDAP